MMKNVCDLLLEVLFNSFLAQLLEGWTHDEESSYEDTIHSQGNASRSTHWLCLIRWHMWLSTYDFTHFQILSPEFLSSSPRIASLLVRCPKGVRQFKRFDSKEPMASRVQAIKLTSWNTMKTPHQYHHHYIISCSSQKLSCPHLVIWKMECHSGAAPPKE